VSRSRLFVGIRSGKALLAELVLDGPTRVTGIEIKKAGLVAAAPSCISALWQEGVAFYGSAVGDSHLLQYRSLSSDSAASAAASDSDPKPSAEPSTASSSSKDSTQDNGVDDDEAAFLFGGGSSSSSSGSSGGGKHSDSSQASEPFRIKLLATIPGIGPILSTGMSLVQRSAVSEVSLANHPRQEQVLAAAGHERGGAILSIRQGLDLRHELKLDIGGATGMWSV